MREITGMLIIALFLSSCGTGSKTKQETSSNDIVNQQEIKLQTDNIVFETINRYSLTFSKIQQFLMDADYSIAPANKVSYAKTISAKKEKIESCIGNSDALAAELSGYRRVVFDTYDTKKPMLLIEQYVFKNERSTGIFVREFKSKTKDQIQERVGVFCFVSKATQAGSTIYVFTSALSEVDSVMWAIKERLDPIILESVAEPVAVVDQADTIRFMLTKTGEFLAKRDLEFTMNVEPCDGGGSRYFFVIPSHRDMEIVIADKRFESKEMAIEEIRTIRKYVDEEPYRHKYFYYSFRIDRTIYTMNSTENISHVRLEIFNYLTNHYEVTKEDIIFH